MQYRLRNELRALRRDPDALEFHLLTLADDILPTHSARVRRTFNRVLGARGIYVHCNAEVVRVANGCIDIRDGEALHTDEIVWVTEAVGAPWLRETGLTLDERGFIVVNDHLQTISDPLIFAAGDVASVAGHPREKAGVFAVRHGPPLATNLRRAVMGQPLRTYRPQRHWLALISTGDRYAVASRGRLGLEGAWVWRWKNWIDWRFMNRFNALPEMTEATTPVRERVQLDQQETVEAISAVAMRCGGCGAKIGASVLTRALAGLAPVRRNDVVIGLDEPDDAAVVRVPLGKAVVSTVDFFRAFIDDPYAFGRIAANHALSDIFAMGAEAQTAMAIATVPAGLEDKIEDAVFQMMSGAVLVLNDANCALVGGHTGEGRELALGFAVNGLIDTDARAAMRKTGMRPGNVLILTKPLGTGTLLAAHAQLAARGRWIDAALEVMYQSNRLGAQCLHAHGATACTDVTGFGLLGHLVEMTRPFGEVAGTGAEIDLAALPVLDGAEETARSGILSSLQPANVRLRRALRNQQTFAAHPRFPLLFDPQTAGGLLASVPASHAEACLQSLVALGYRQAALIGRVLAPAEAGAPVTLAP
jgi:selenide, water dikinase